MLRPVLTYLYQSFKRLASPSDERRGVLEEGQPRTSVWAYAVMAALLLYILGGLGYFAKFHVWDEMTAEQQAIMIKSMQVDPQLL